MRFVHGFWRRETVRALWSWQRRRRIPLDEQHAAALYSVARSLHSTPLLWKKRTRNTAEKDWGWPGQSPEQEKAWIEAALRGFESVEPPPNNRTKGDASNGQDTTQFRIRYQPTRGPPPRAALRHLRSAELDTSPPLEMGEEGPGGSRTPALYPGPSRLYWKEAEAASRKLKKEAPFPSFYSLKVEKAADGGPDEANNQALYPGSYSLNLDKEKGHLLAPVKDWGSDSPLGDVSWLPPPGLPEAGRPRPENLKVKKKQARGTRTWRERPRSRQNSGKMGRARR